MHIVTFLVLGATLVGCGKKTAPEAPADAPAGKVEFTAEMPDSAEARGFAERLVATEISNWKPTDDGVLRYESLRFAPDGSWNAAAELKAGGEVMECKEIGTWKIDAAATSEAALMEWTIVKTNCAGRENGVVQRVQMSIAADGTYRIAFR